MRNTLILILSGMLPLAAQGVDTLDLSGVGFALTSSEILQAQPFMIKILSFSPKDDSSATRTWKVGLAAMRLGFKTYFLDVITLDSQTLLASIQEVSANEYNQQVLGDRVGELKLNISPLSGISGGRGSLTISGLTQTIFFYTPGVTNTFTRWVETLD